MHIGGGRGGGGTINASFLFLPHSLLPPPHPFPSIPSNHNSPLLSAFIKGGGGGGQSKQTHTLLCMGAIMKMCGQTSTTTLLSQPWFNILTTTNMGPNAARRTSSSLCALRCARYTHPFGSSLVLDELVDDAKKCFLDQLGGTLKPFLYTVHCFQHGIPCL